MIYRCSRCGCLYNSNSEKNRGYCKECRAEYKAEYYQKNKERVLEKCAEYYQKNKDKIREQQAEYKKTDAGKEASRRGSKRYHQTEKGKKTLRRAQKRYYQTEKGKEAKRRGDHKRRARKANTISDDWKPSEIFKRDQGICHICGLPVYDYEDAPDALKPNYDHYVPIAKCGTNTRDNVMLAHAHCNFVKSDHWMHEVDREACREHISKVLEELADELL